jgi:DNA invertase Pin-like site-specific DNA recombinase
MRLVAYLRVSSVGQIDAWGLDRQERAIKAWASTHGHRVAAWHRDEGVSGTLGHLSRPGFTAAVAELGHRADGLIVADLDRLARELTVQEAALGVIWSRHAPVFTATGGEVQQDDPDDPARSFVRKVMGLVIEYEKNQAVRRLRQGREAKAAAGRKAVGQYAYGYHGAGKGRERDAAPEPEEQRAVATIVRMRKAGKSFREIAAELERQGMKPRRAERWWPMSVRSVARRAGVG